VTESAAVAVYIDPPSHHYLNDRVFVVDDGRPSGDRLMEPWAHMRARLEAHGIPVHTADLMPPETPGAATTNIYFSMGMLDNYRAIARRRDTVLSAFFAFECPIVEPSLYRALVDVQQYFRHVFSWSDSAALERFVGQPLRCDLFRWPQSFDAVHPAIWSRTDRKFLVMINSNKLPRVYWQELYTERLKAVEFFAQTDDIDLYGPRWDEPSNRVGKTWVPATARRIQRELLIKWQRLRPDPLLVAARRVWRGQARSKAETLGGYTFAICFENMVLKGWITEKIFDCFFAGTVPIYWGAPEIAELIPSECFIDMRQFGSYAELARFLKTLRGEEIQRYRESARAFLASPEFEPFTKEAFAQRFIRLVDEVRAAQPSAPARV
jgi:hypothetical protein